MECLRDFVYNRSRKNVTRNILYNLYCFLIAFVWILSSPVVGRPAPLLAEFRIDKPPHDDLATPSLREVAKQSQSQLQAPLFVEQAPQACPHLPVLLFDPPAQARDEAHISTFLERGLGSGYNVKRKLSGPGSAPPNCNTKCGTCTPCKPVHVPIEPGRNSIGLMEYYPEAWRCKCKNKLYMP